jgi:hypothetical protein
MYWGVDVQIHVFFTSVLVVSGQLHAPVRLPPFTDWKGGLWALESVSTVWRGESNTVH